MTALHFAAGWLACGVASLVACRVARMLPFRWTQRAIIVLGGPIPLLAMLVAVSEGEQ